MTRVQFKGTSLSIDADLYDRFEEIRSGDHDDVSDEKLQQMVQLCETFYQKQEFSYYAVERLGVAAARVCEFVPELSLADRQRLRHIVACRNGRQRQREETTRQLYTTRP